MRLQSGSVSCKPLVFLRGGKPQTARATAATFVKNDLRACANLLARSIRGDVGFYLVVDDPNLVDEDVVVNPGGKSLGLYLRRGLFRIRHDF